MIPTQQCRPFSGPCAVDIKDDDDADHRCSIGAWAGIFCFSIPSNSLSMNSISLPLFSSCVPVGKQTSKTHCYDIREIVRMRLANRAGVRTIHMSDLLGLHNRTGEVGHLAWFGSLHCGSRTQLRLDYISLHVQLTMDQKLAERLSGTGGNKF
jgi:hypothetical protein